LVLSDALGAAALLATIQSAFPTVTAVSYTALTTTTGVLANATAATTARITTSTAAVPTRRPPPSVGIIAALVIVCAIAALLALCTCFRRRESWGVISTDVLKGVRIHADAAPNTSCGVFVSYRRSDFAVADAVVDQLSLAGLRAFYDRGGEMAGRPFEEELHRAIRESRVTCVLVTLELMRSLVAHRPDRLDWLLAELLLALHYMRTQPGRRIFPLLFGSPMDGDVGVPQRSYLLTDAAFMACRDALPDVVPVATLALVTRMLAQDGGELDAALQGITVRQLMLGERHQVLAERQEPFTGLLAISSVAVHGPDDHMGLLLRHRYAEHILSAL